MDKEYKWDSQGLSVLRLYIEMLISDVWVEKVLLNNLERTKKLNLASLKPVFNRPEEEVKVIWYNGFVGRTLASFAINPVEVEKSNIDRLKTKVNLLVDTKEANLSDITAMYHEQRLTFLDFIPFYAKTVQESISLVKEIENYFYEVTSYATKILAEVQNEMLQDSISFSSHIANSTPDIIYVFDIETKKYVYANKELTSLLGYKGQSFIEANNALGSDVFLPEDKNVLLDRYNKYPLLQDNEILEDTLRVKDFEGNIRYLCTRALVFKRSAEGKVEQVMGIAQDVTNQKATEVKFKESEAKALEALNELRQIKIELESINSELEKRVEERTLDLKESEAKYRFMAESIPAIVWTANPDGHIDYYSKRWTDYTGLTLEETVGWGWQALPHADDLQPTIDAWKKSLISGEEYKIEHRIKGRDGEYRWMLTRAVPFKDEDGEIVKWFGTAVDVNDEKVWAEKLKESEERFRSMADNLPVLAWMADENGYIFWYNKTWYEYTGTTPEQMEGWGWKSVHDPNELDKVLEKWIHSISTGETFEMVFPLRGVDGTFHPFLTRVVPVRNMDGKIIQWFGTNTDIFAERQREESIRMQSIVLESMNEGVSVSDDTGVILYTNESEDQMFGYERGGLIGKHVSVQNAYPPQENEEKVSIVIGELKAKGFWEGEWKNIKKDGTVFHTYSFISTLSLENKDLFVCVQRDITDELNYKREILERNAELESINNDLDNFVYTASHDLKSPVSNIEGLVHAIKDTEYYNIEELKTLVDMMGTSVDRFKHTILDLTEISKIQKTFTDDIVEVDLNDLMEDVRFSIANLIKESKAIIKTDFSDVKEILFSKKNLRSMLYNLISNAVKYNSPDRRPEIFVKTSKEDGFVKITVKDNGLGIRQESLGKLFMMFKRLHTHVEGSGVGLYIVKKMIENAGGRIEVESQEGVGSTFSLYIKINVV